jgi:hypothetical protein
MSHLSLSASGLTISYHQGVVKHLMARKIINTKTKFSGTSGGAVTSILTKCNICPDKQHKLTKEVLNLVNSKKEKNIAIVFDKYLQNNIPENAADLCNSFVNCSMFKLAWPFPRSYILDAFENKQDVIDATISSCYIPFVIGDSLTWNFRGQRHVDGGLKKENILMQIENGIHIASMPKSQVDHYEFNSYTDIYMGINGTLPFDESVINNSSYAIHEDPDYFCNCLYELGQLDAEYYISNNI